MREPPALWATHPPRSLGPTDGRQVETGGVPVKNHSGHVGRVRPSRFAFVFSLAGLAFGRPKWAGIIPPEGTGDYSAATQFTSSFAPKRVVVLNLILSPMSAENLQELLIEELKDIYNAEQQLTKALPKMAKAAVNENLKAGFLAHLEETEEHVQRLEQIFELLDEKAKGKTCKAMKGLVEEGAEAIKENDPSLTRDAQLIGAAQRVEHYEIAAYGTVRAMAQLLGHKEVAALLKETLDEEAATDKKLTTIATEVNRGAIDEDSED